MSVFGERRRRANLLDMYPVPLTISPASGIVGLLVTIKGSGLSAVTGVTVNGISALAVIVVDDTTVTAVVPTVGLGNVPVIVTSLNGNNLVPGGFTVSLT